MELATMADTLTLTQHLTTTLQFTSIILPLDSIAPSPVRSKSTCRPRRALLKRRRTRRRSPPPENDSDDSSTFLSLLFSGGDDGGGRNGGNNGGGNNFDRFNWNNNNDDYNDNDELNSYIGDPAFDFVYEVVCWIVFSNCLHFAFKKVVKLASESKEKVWVC